MIILHFQCLSSKTSKDKVGKFFYDKKREIIFVRFRLDISGDVKGPGKDEIKQ